MSTSCLLRENILGSFLCFSLSVSLSRCAFRRSSLRLTYSHPCDWPRNLLRLQMTRISIRTGSVPTTFFPFWQSVKWLCVRRWTHLCAYECNCVFADGESKTNKFHSLNEESKHNELSFCLTNLHMNFFVWIHFVRKRNELVLCVLRFLLGLALYDSNWDRLRD